MRTQFTVALTILSLGIVMIGLLLIAGHMREERCMRDGETVTMLTSQGWVQDDIRVHPTCFYRPKFGFTLN